MSPTFCWTLPSTFSAVPLSCKSGLPITWPVFSLAAPTPSFIVPSALSLVLEFIPLFRVRRKQRPYLLSRSGPDQEATTRLASKKHQRFAELTSAHDQENISPAQIADVELTARVLA